MPVDTQSKKCEKAENTPFGLTRGSVFLLWKPEENRGAKCEKVLYNKAIKCTYHREVLGDNK